MRQAAVRCVVVSVIGLLCARDAQAQDTGGTPNYPPPGSGTPNYPPPAGTPSAPPPAAPPPAVAPGSQPPPGAAPPPRGPAEEPEEKDEGRLRVGFNLNGGVGSGSNRSGLTLGATFRLGWQVNRLIGAYGQVSPIVWFGVASDKTATSFSAIGGFQFTPLFSLTPADLIELAAGPSLDKLSGGGASAGVTGGTATAGVSAFSGLYFALHGRVALHIGGKPNTSTGRRTSFTIGFDVHPTFADGSTITFYTVGLGADWY